MRRLLLDQSAPIGLRPLLVGYEVRTAREMGWDAISNGELLAAAERDGFHVFVTADQNMQYQQNITGRRIAVIVLATNRWLTIKTEAASVVNACATAGEGAYVVVVLPRPKLRRRSRHDLFPS